MILRSNDGNTTALVPKRWVDANGTVHEYHADFKELRIEFVDNRGTISTVTEFVKVSD